MRGQAQGLGAGRRQRILMAKIREANLAFLVEINDALAKADG